MDELSYLLLIVGCLMMAGLVLVVFLDEIRYIIKRRKARGWRRYQMRNMRKPY